MGIRGPLSPNNIYIALGNQLRSGDKLHEMGKLSEDVKLKWQCISGDLIAISPMFCITAS